MKVSLFPFLFSILCCPPLLHAQADANSTKERLLAEFKGRVLLISASTGGACGTAFRQEEGRLYINAHLAEALCPLGNCADVTLTITAPGGRPEERRQISHPKLAALVRTLDLAVLDVPGPSFTPAPLKLAPKGTPAGAPLYAIGYPGCRELRISGGQLLERTPLSLRTSIPGNFGSSGSVIVDERGRLLGLAVQSSSFRDALSAQVFASDFPLEAAPLDLFPEPIPQLTAANLRTLAQFVLRYHEEQVNMRSGLERLFSGLQFISLADRLELDWLSSPAPPDLRAWLLLGRYPGELLGRAEAFYKDADHTLLKLVLAYDLEYLGARAGLTQSLPVLAQADLPGVPEPLKTQLLAQLKSFGRHPGLRFMIMRYGIYLLFGTAIVLGVLGCCLTARIMKSLRRRWARSRSGA